MDTRSEIKGQPMPTKLVELEDSILVEIEVPADEVHPISGSFADKITGSLDKIKPIIMKTCKPIINAWKELSEEIYIEKAEVELGLSFEGEGNIYITKSKAGANLTVKIILKPQIIKNQMDR